MWIATFHTGHRTISPEPISQQKCPKKKSIQQVTGFSFSLHWSSFSSCFSRYQTPILLHDELGLFSVKLYLELRPS